MLANSATCKKTNFAGGGKNVLVTALFFFVTSTYDISFYFYSTILYNCSLETTTTTTTKTMTMTTMMTITTQTKTTTVMVIIYAIPYRPTHNNRLYID